MSAARKLRALRTRGDYLSQRITAQGGPKREIEELAALAWALPILDDLVARKLDVAADVHRQSRDAAYAWLASVAVEHLAVCDPPTAARLLAECSDPTVRKAVLRNVQRHGPVGLSGYLAELASVR